MILPNVVALVGKLGHGKTALLNKLTGTTHASDMRATSCTRTLQFGYTRKHGILIVDTPGFCSSDKIAAHIAAQKLALEGTHLSGVYIVVKYGRSDDIAEMVSKIITFIGSDDIRIIVTFADTAVGQDGYDPDQLKSRLSQTLDVPKEHIAVVGKGSPTPPIESFLHTTLHEPRAFTVSENQVASITSLSVGTRRFNKAIHEVYAKIAAASKACVEMTKMEQSYHTDTAIVTLQQSTTKMVLESKERIFMDAEDLDPDIQNVIYGKAGLALSLRLKAFIDSTNKFLTWDVTNLSDKRNEYKKCNHCGAIFNKTEGCDGETICGAVPGGSRRPRPLLIAEFEASGSDWVVQYYWDRTKVKIVCVLERLRDYMKLSTWNSSFEHVKNEGAAFESGCGSAISWRTMLPVEPERIQALGLVELLDPGQPEVAARNNFDENLRRHEESNLEILSSALSSLFE